MKVSKEMITKAREVIDEMELDSKYGYIGIRVQEQPFELGALDHVSHVWDDGDDLGIELNGVCVTSINSRVVPEYCGDHIALICGDCAEYGEDAGELIIEDAVVEYIFC